MENKRKLNSIEKIEEMFAEDIDLLQSGKSHTKKALEKIKIKQLLSIPSFLLKKIYKVLPGVLKDIFFWSSVFHKAPYSKFVAKTKYDEFRTLLDIKASALILKYSRRSGLSAPIGFDKSRYTSGSARSIESDW